MIKRVGAIIVHDKKLLVVREKERTTFISPGGSRKRGETAEQTLKRELKEELGVDVASWEHFATLYGTTIQTQVPLENAFYVAQITGDPAPAMEIEDMAWITRELEVPISPMLREQLLPMLKERGLL